MIMSQGFYDQASDCCFLSFIFTLEYRNSDACPIRNIRWTGKYSLNVMLEIKGHMFGIQLTISALLISVHPFHPFPTLIGLLELLKQSTTNCVT